MTTETFIIVLCAAASAFCFGISLVPARSPLALRLSRLEAIAERAPDKRLEQIARILGAERRSRLQDRLTAGGWYHVTPVAFLLRSAGFAGAGVIAGVAAGFALPDHRLGIFTGACVALLAARIPKIALDRAIGERHKRITRELPDFLDLLAATVRAGLALNLALVQTADACSGPLREELRSTLAEMRLGRPRGDALKAMAQRIGEQQVRTLVAGIVEAERLGANISSVLRELADDTRNHRWMVAEERAAKLPVKMVFPMALLMLPSLYIMIFGPVVARYLTK